MEKGQVIYGRNNSYRIEEQLRTGLYATGYKAVNLKTGEPVVVKQAPGKSPLEEARVRLKQEASILSTIERAETVKGTHFVIRLLDDHDTPDDYWQVQEMAPGVTLESFLVDRRPEDEQDIITDFILDWRLISEDEVLDVFTQVAQMLMIVHESRLLYLDFKPDHVFVERALEGERVKVKVIDWNVAEVMPSGPAADERRQQDLAKLCGLMSWVFLGKGTDADSLEARLRSPDGKILSFGTQLILRRAFHATPRHRYTKAADLRTDLQGHLEDWHRPVAGAGGLLDEAKPYSHDPSIESMRHVLILGDLALRKEPDNPEAKGLWEEAQKSIRDAVKRQLTLALSDIGSGQYLAARTKYEDARILAPDSDVLRWGLLIVAAAETRGITKDLSDRLRDAAKALADDKWADARQALKEAMAYTTDEPLKERIRFVSADIFATEKALKARSALDSGDVETGLRLAEEALRESSDNVLAQQVQTEAESQIKQGCQRGEEHLQRGEYEAAINALRELPGDRANHLRQEAKSMAGYNTAASIALEKEDWETAIEAANQALTMAPGSEEAKKYLDEAIGKKQTLALNLCKQAMAVFDNAGFSSATQRIDEAFRLYPAHAGIQEAHSRIHAVADLSEEIQRTLGGEPSSSAPYASIISKLENSPYRDNTALKRYLAQATAKKAYWSDFESLQADLRAAHSLADIQALRKKLTPLLERYPADPQIDGLKMTAAGKYWDLILEDIRQLTGRAASPADWSNVFGKLDELKRENPPAGWASRAEQADREAKEGYIGSTVKAIYAALQNDAPNEATGLLTRLKDSGLGAESHVREAERAINAYEGRHGHLVKAEELLKEASWREEQLSTAKAILAGLQASVGDGGVGYRNSEAQQVEAGLRRRIEELDVLASINSSVNKLESITSRLESRVSEIGEKGTKPSEPPVPSGEEERVRGWDRTALIWGLFVAALVAAEVWALRSMLTSAVMASSGNLLFILVLLAAAVSVLVIWFVWQVLEIAEVGRLIWEIPLWVKVVLVAIPLVIVTAVIVAPYVPQVVRGALGVSPTSTTPSPTRTPRPTLEPTLRSPAVTPGPTLTPTATAPAVPTPTKTPMRKAGTLKPGRDATLFAGPQPTPGERSLGTLTASKAITVPLFVEITEGENLSQVRYKVTVVGRLSYNRFITAEKKPARSALTSQPQPLVTFQGALRSVSIPDPDPSLVYAEIGKLKVNTPVRITGWEPDSEEWEWALVEVDGYLEAGAVNLEPN
jgi:tetratricopeptide (TPR) repeat protein